MWHCVWFSFLVSKFLRFSGSVCMAVFIAALLELQYVTQSESEQEDDLCDFVNSCLGIEY